MTEKIPSAFINGKTGDVERLETLADQIKGDILPGAAVYGIIGLKLFLLAPFIAVAAPLTAAVYGLSRLSIRLKVNKQLGDGFDTLERLGTFQRFNLPGDKDFLPSSFDAGHPTFAEEYALTARIAKLDNAPLIVFNPGTLAGDGAADKIGAASALSLTDGSGGRILMDSRALKDLTAPELRAVIAHEMTHLKLRHTKAAVRDIARKAVNTLLNAGLLAAAVFGPLPLLPVVGLIAGTALANKLIKSGRSRHRERLGDRGAMLLTGGGSDLTSGLKKIHADEMRRMGRTERKILALLDEGTFLGGTLQVVAGTHPTLTSRTRALAAFEKSYPDYCKKQRDKFNAVAAAPPPPAAPSKPAEPRQPEPPAISLSALEKQWRELALQMKSASAAAKDVDEEELERFFTKKPPEVKPPAP